MNTHVIRLHCAKAKRRRSKRKKKKREKKKGQLDNYSLQEKPLQGIRIPQT